MKRYVAILLAIMFIFLCACNKDTDDTTTGAEETQETTLPQEITTVKSLEADDVEPARIITVYFSHSLDPIDAVAGYLSDELGSELCEIETVKEYPEQEKELVKVAQQEHSSNFRPALVNAPVNLREYDIVFLCFPSWDNTMPMAVWTFIEDYDMRDMAVIPVCYGSSQTLTNAIRDINSLKPGMMVVEGFSFSSDFLSVADDFREWVNFSLYG